MTDAADAYRPLTRQQRAAIGRTERGKVTGRLKRALDAMVWNGMKRRDAATSAGLQEQSLYVALTRPHVRAYYLRQLDVLRTSERARNIHALVGIRDDERNQMARVQAVRTLEQIADDNAGPRSAGSSPGLTIVVVSPMPHSRDSDAKSLIDLAPVRDSA